MATKIRIPSKRFEFSEVLIYIIDAHYGQYSNIKTVIELLVSGGTIPASDDSGFESKFMFIPCHPITFPTNNSTQLTPNQILKFLKIAPNYCFGPSDISLAPPKFW
jgi:hypothetical protein